ncbi:hypothetical protein [Sphingomonas sp. ERG5]|uniref:hypothetical protein n=1 Tax=Sphingomonas sp. ERG5 TaxID=1381597 RepID=UPI0013649305|nr:hypothetical protein [Sphingomonas sp. ERG5]
MTGKGGLNVMFCSIPVLPIQRVGRIALARRAIFAPESKHDEVEWTSESTRCAAMANIGAARQKFVLIK